MPTHEAVVSPVVTGLVRRADGPTPDPSWCHSAAVPGGYALVPFDALSPSGDGLVCIFFCGSVFSPSYAARLRRQERPLPAEHAAVNLALYRGGRQVAWVMSEYRGVAALDDGRVAIGGSQLLREGTAEGAPIRIDLVERSAPGRRRVEGSILVEPETPALGEHLIGPASGARHGWKVLAPRARVRARFRHPDFTLDAPGYHDRNHGDGRLEDAFSRWGWARFHGTRETTVLYTITERGGRRSALLLRARDGERDVMPIEAEVPSSADEGELRRAAYGLSLPRSFGVGGDRILRCEPGALLEQAPFYARYRARLVDGERPSAAAAGVEGMGEYLDLDRFRSRFVQFLLGFKTRHGGDGSRSPVAPLVDGVEPA